MDLTIKLNTTSQKIKLNVFHDTLKRLKTVDNIIEEIWIYTKRVLVKKEKYYHEIDAREEKINGKTLTS